MHHHEDMARAESLELPVPAGVSAGGALSLEGWYDVGVIVSGVFNATVQIEVSADGGTTFAPIGAALTAPGSFEIPFSGRIHVRARNTAYVSGPPKVVVVGLVL